MAVVSCWQWANAQFRHTVIFQDRSIQRKIQVAWTAVEDFLWNRGGMKREEDRKKFLYNLDSLFNIASCSHEILSGDPAQSQVVRDVRRGHTC